MPRGPATVPDTVKPGAESRSPMAARSTRAGDIAVTGIAVTPSLPPEERPPLEQPEASRHAVVRTIAAKAGRKGNVTGNSCREKPPRNNGTGVVNSCIPAARGLCGAFAIQHPSGQVSSVTAALIQCRDSVASAVI